MTKGIKALLLAATILAGCDGGGGGGGAPATADFSGRYYVTLGALERVILDVVSDGGRVTFTASGALPISGTGTVEGNRLVLSADVGGVATFSFEATSPDGGATFAGEARVAGDIRFQATVTGTRTPWTVYDLDALGVPRFTTAEVIDLDAIARLSRFRSGEGHDYSDDVESCRSMKHYYYPKDGVERSAVRLYAPVAGTVIGTLEEYQGATSTGKQIGIRPAGYPAFSVIVFHVNPARPFAVGDRVAAGELLGTSAKTSGTVSDVAVWVHTPGADRLVSFFDTMDDAVFAAYPPRGVGSRAAAIITRAERDADPLTCSGETFASPGNLLNWVDLN